jgi:hypothetical protein
VYIERIEDPRGLAKPAEVSCQGGSRVVYQQETWADALAFPAQFKEDGLKARVPKYLSRRQRTGNVCMRIRGAFREHAGSIQVELKRTPMGLHPNCKKHLTKVPSG